MKNFSLWLAVSVLFILIITVGCGLAIHFGGEPFKKAITGHMVLGIIALILSLIMVISFFIK